MDFLSEERETSQILEKNYVTYLEMIFIFFRMMECKCEVNLQKHQKHTHNTHKFFFFNSKQSEIDETDT
jgi:hypothetical protein